MGMPRGLIKATAYYNKVEALLDYDKLSKMHPEIAKQYPISTNWGWRRIDRQTLNLRLGIERHIQAAKE